MNPAGETLYLAGSGVMAERLLGAGGVVQWTNYLSAGGEMVGMRVDRSDATTYTRYFHKDHLGSIATITDAAGAVVERLSYDAWGKRRFPNGQDDPSGSIASQTTRGFTGHEQLADVGLVHMNGRVYDPMLGRFGTPDPMTESPYDSQGWNRYTYVGNSPLNATDPSGYCWLGCFWQKPFKALGKLLRKVPIIGQILTVAAGLICGPICSSITSAVVTGLASGDLGLALKAGLISMATAAAFTAVGDMTGAFPGTLDKELLGHGPLEFMSEAHVFNIAGHAAVGCGSAVASGGKCGPGALSGAIGSFAGPMFHGLKSEAKLIATATVGGLASVAGGGKFGNGAVTAAFGYLYNEAAVSNYEQRGYQSGPNKPGFGECLGQCTMEQFGLNDIFGDGFDDAAGRGALAAGAAPIPKSWAGVPITSGASRYTNGTSLLGLEIYKVSPGLEPRMPFRFMGTTRLFGMVGRAIPFVGAGIAAYDAGSIGYCTYQCVRGKP